jgi:hypothetical protein
MTYSESFPPTITTRQAKQICLEHGVTVWQEANLLIDADRESICEITNGQVESAEVLDWLGY